MLKWFDELLNQVLSDHCAHSILIGPKDFSGIRPNTKIVINYESSRIDHNWLGVHYGQTIEIFNIRTRSKMEVLRTLLHELEHERQAASGWLTFGTTEHDQLRKLKRWFGSRVIRKTPWRRVKRLLFDLYFHEKVECKARAAAGETYTKPWKLSKQKKYAAAYLGIDLKLFASRQNRATESSTLQGANKQKIAYDAPEENLVMRTVKKEKRNPSRTQTLYIAIDLGETNYILDHRICREASHASQRRPPLMVVNGVKRKEPNDEATTKKRSVLIQTARIFFFFFYDAKHGSGIRRFYCECPIARGSRGSITSVSETRLLYMYNSLPVDNKTGNSQLCVKWQKEKKMKINVMINGYLDKAIVTETVNSVELLMGLVEHESFSIHLIDGSGFGERDVVVTFKEGEFILACQEYDDGEAFHKFTTTKLNEAWECLKSYATEPVLKPSEAYM